MWESGEQDIPARASVFSLQYGDLSGRGLHGRTQEAEEVGEDVCRGVLWRSGKQNTSDVWQDWATSVLLSNERSSSRNMCISLSSCSGLERVGRLFH